ncbi:MAG: UDP-N-acetylglucosamine--N-acetylmuramyl-(pentapeptide) pyrophosphoryl-undecaprenol N-acetylglucosamine transferase [Candidatus Omnitrophica bacterium]|jgi:UDP-N-acetylglucosamine--N-acetylmuramyl-(pentapeptide) pyrophosphoryl-undecaprenol N-acetylglucosamine transferase|nr:UDP-N-acetylglucosamine--N-acetylmuramyl-(pentapeptide) pyrophosphoryl-undecaprenol N-acetylglucosamine transferase [Candidatus Omnitrophota bacterium]
MRILLACERSGGHIFPALCFGKKILRKFQQQGQKDIRVIFFITSEYLKQYVKKEGFEVIGTSVNSRSLIVELFWRFWEALYIIIKQRPNKVIGFGGRDSFFLILFSSLFISDTVIYEPNAGLGKANRLLSLFVKRVLRGLEPLSKRKKDQIIGVPLRENIKKIEKKEARKILNFNEETVVLCLGGSQGSVFINKVFLDYAEHSSSNFQIIHLTGLKDYTNISERYKKIRNNKFVQDFYYQIGILYSAADIVVSRSGALTLGEISFYGLPSILIPYPSSAGHQEDNANHFKRKQAAYVIRQNSFSFSEFSHCLDSLMQDRNLRTIMGNNAQQINSGVSFEDFCNRANY